MIYKGKEKENHRGSHVKYYHGKWLEGTLLEPVNYQIVVTKEHPTAVLSCHTKIYPKEEDYKQALENVRNENYTIGDLKVLESKLNGYSSEVESVEITDANDITDEEADAIIKERLELLAKQPKYDINDGVDF